MKPDSMNLLFLALAHPVRRKILDLVRDEPGVSVGDVCDYFEISRIAVLKHLRALERAQLILSQKAGRTRALYFNAVPIQMIYDRWTSAYSALWASGLTRLKYRIEKQTAGLAVQPRGNRPSLADLEPSTKRKRHA